MSTKDSLKIEEGRDDLPFQIHWELDDAPLTVDAFRVYAHLVRCAGKNGEIFPSYQTIGEKCFRATVGAGANPRSLRNRAMKAMKELITCGLVLKQIRTKRDRSENDSNLYTLTPRWQWLDGLKAQRAALDAETAAIREARQLELQGGGGIPTMTPPGTPTMPGGIPTMTPPGIPTMPPGIPTMPEVTSTEVLQSFEVSSKEETSSSAPLNPRESSAADDDGQTADAGTPVVGQASPAAGGEATAPARPGQAQVLRTAQHGATSTETVPPAAALGGSAILALTPIPRAELEARAARDPARMVQLRALLSASHKSRLPHLEAELALATRSGVPRSLLTRLTDPELFQAAAAARQDAGLVEGGFVKAGVHALHRLIGEPLTLDTLQGQRTPVDEPPLGRAYEVKNGGQAPAAEEPASTPEGRLRAGALWRRRGGDEELVMIRSVHNFQYTLSTGQTLKANELARQFVFEAAPSEASA